MQWLSIEEGLVARDYSTLGRHHSFAEPSLESLLTMSSMQDATRGPASAANAGACAELVAGYRQALVQVCNHFKMPVLIADADDELHEWPVRALDEWLRPPAS